MAAKRVLDDMVPKEWSALWEATIEVLPLIKTVIKNYLKHLQIALLKNAIELGFVVEVSIMYICNLRNDFRHGTKENCGELLRKNSKTNPE